TRGRIMILCDRSKFFDSDHWRTMLDMVGVNQEDYVLSKATTKLVCSIICPVSCNRRDIATLVRRDPLLKLFIRVEWINADFVFWLSVFGPEKSMKMSIERFRSSFLSVTIQEAY